MQFVRIASVKINDLKNLCKQQVIFNNWTMFIAPVIFKYIVLNLFTLKKLYYYINIYIFLISNILINCVFQPQPGLDVAK